ncbi:hypothetical protein CYLTODRAFT_420041 [Cylindrobasidium torrendii FP15055 ss-10]|uniref:Uncharacterized protein n=1 Tax=Cylindrobasidium torrendii FP15055 ss-10 TaxID=1314674 RepID=A0A0D7BJ09_9AGAR|nr:hypothetical protein CYLTODRAFT_420041 [Cylindrobasidium torrendii FP15055 ss-10]
MSHKTAAESTSPSSSGKKNNKSKSTRPLSASQISKNKNHFETWTERQNSSLVSFDSLPQDLRTSVDDVFEVRGRIPSSWLKKGSKAYKLLRSVAKPGLIDFLRDAKESEETLFTCDGEDDDGLKEFPILFSQITKVFDAWVSFTKMKNSAQTYSEADFATACDSFRISAMTLSRPRAQSSISLSHPLDLRGLHPNGVRILSVKTAKPDMVIFIPRLLIADLSDPKGSAFQVLRKHPKVKLAGRPEKGSSFSFQATVRDKLPEKPGFEIASSCWEDKKPVQTSVQSAFNQNRMATIAAVRHLESLGINAPIYGLVWANGTVQAHVDWWEHTASKKGKRSVLVYTAKFPNRKTQDAQKWKLHKPADILHVNFLVSNIDHWTCNGFKDAVVNGIEGLRTSVVENKGQYTRWKRTGTIEVDDRNKASSIMGVGIPLFPQDTNIDRKPRVKR